MTGSPDQLPIHFRVAPSRGRNCPSSLVVLSMAERMRACERSSREQEKRIRNVKNRDTAIRESWTHVRRRCHIASAAFKLLIAQLRLYP